MVAGQGDAAAVAAQWDSTRGYSSTSDVCRIGGKFVAAVVLAGALLGLLPPDEAAAQVTSGGNQGSRLCEVLGTCNANGGSMLPGGAPDGGGGGTCGPAAGGSTECGGSGPAAMSSPTGTSIGVGNPINLASGNKYQQEVDLPPLPGELGLEIVRHYNSASREQGWIGRNWRLSYDTRLTLLGSTVQIIQADGRRLMFDRDPAHPGLCVSRNPDLGEVRLDSDGSAPRYRWIWRDGRILHFDAAGLLEAIEAPSGARLTLWRGPKGELLRVRDPQGRELVFAYDRAAAKGWGGVQAIRSPVGTFRYQHATTGPLAGNLMGVERPDGQAGRRYHYAAQPGEGASADDIVSPGTDAQLRRAGAHLLTGITEWGLDADGRQQWRRLSRYRYDERGRAIETQRLDDRGEVLEALRIEYVRSGLFDLRRGRLANTAPAPGYTVVTDHRGRRTEFWHGVAGDQHALHAVRGDGCAGCPDPGLEFGYTTRGQLAGYLEQRPGQEGLLTRFERDRQGRVIGVWQQEVAARPAGVEQLRLEGRARWRVRYEYDGSARHPSRIVRPSVVAGEAHQLEIRYNERGQPIELTERGWEPAGAGAKAQPLVRTSRYHYRTIDGVARLAAIDGPLPGPDDTIYFEHDGQGRPRRVHHPAPGVQESYEYDSAGRLTVHVPMDAVPVHMEFDASGEPFRWRRGDVTLALRRDGFGRPIRWERNDGRSLSLEYDNKGQVAAVVESDGSRQELHRDTDGRVVEVQGRDGAGRTPFEPHRFRYDAQGRLIESGTGTQHFYDGHGRLARSVNALQHEVRYTYDRLHRLTGMEQRAGDDAPYRVLRTTWSGAAPQGQTSILTRLLYEGDDPMPHGLLAGNGAKTTRVLDDFGRLLRVSSSDTGTAVARYDLADRVIEAIDAQGRRTTFLRDAMGRELERRLTGAFGEEEESVIRRYEGARLASVANRHQTDHFEWDPQGRLVRQVTRLSRFDGSTAAAFLPSFVTSYRYDDAGRLKEKHLPDGLVLLPIYDSAGRATGLFLRTPGGITQLIAKAQLDGLRGMTELTFGNGTRTAYARDRHGRVVGLATTKSAGSGEGTLLYGQRLEYDLAGRIVAIERDGQTEHYGYDAFDRLIEASNRAASERFAYDPVGNRTRWWILDRSPGSTTKTSTAFEQVGPREYVAQHTPASNRLKSIASVDGRAASGMGEAWTYDATGNPSRSPGVKGYRSYTYGADGRMRQVRVTVGGNEEVLADYRYNAAGERVLKKTAEGVTYYLYAENKIVAEVDEQGSIKAHYIYTGHVPIAKIETRTAAGSLSTGWSDIRVPAWKRFVLWIRSLTTEGSADGRPSGPTSIRILGLHGDHLGTPQLATDATQRVIWRSSYTAFGAALVDEDPNRDGIATRISLRLPGQYFDPETQTHYNYFRDYDPALGRYLQSDPLGIAAGANTYAYVLSAPLSLIDPLGLIVEQEADDSATSDRVPMPWRFGGLVHALFADWVISTNSPKFDGEWGGNDGNRRVWRSLRPDAYHNAQESNPWGSSGGDLWELKPNSHQLCNNASRYRAALGQVSSYMASASPGLGLWLQGDVDALFSGSTAEIGAVRYWGQWYKITLHVDSSPQGWNSGLVFYTQKRISRGGGSLLEELNEFFQHFGNTVYLIWGPGGPNTPTHRPQF